VGTTHSDGTYTNWREETWHLPGAAGKLMFDEELLQRQFGRHHPPAHGARCGSQ
jgi:hypothetical protein